MFKSENFLLTFLELQNFVIPACLRLPAGRQGRQVKTGIQSVSPVSSTGQALRRQGTIKNLDSPHQVRGRLCFRRNDDGISQNLKYFWLDSCSKEEGRVGGASKRMDDEQNKRLTENGNRVYDFP